MKTFKVLSSVAIFFLLASPMISALDLALPGEISNSTGIGLIIGNNDENKDEDKPSEWDKIREQEQQKLSGLHETKYSEWLCISSRLQRAVTYLGNTKTQYGGICGLELPASEKTPALGNIIFSILITILSVIIVIVIIILLVLVFKR